MPANSTLLLLMLAVLAACASHERRPEEDAGASDTAPDGDIPCTTLWSDPILESTVTVRPSSPTFELDFRYQVRDGRGVITLDGFRESVVGVSMSEGPFYPEVNSGSWVELQDASGRMLYTQGAWQLVPTNVEVSGPGGGFSHVPDFCPRMEGSFRTPRLPNDPSAAAVVLFQEVPGTDGGRTVEFARIPLP